MPYKKLFSLILISAIFSSLIMGVPRAVINTPQNGHCLNNTLSKVGYNLQSLLTNSEKILDSVQIIITFTSKTAMKDAIPKIASISPEIRFIREWQLISIAAFHAPVSDIEKIARLSEVEKIWLDQQFTIPNFLGTQSDEARISEIVTPNLSNFLHATNSDNYLEKYNGTNVIVALLDTGVDIFHPDLNNSILAFGGVSMVEGDPFPLDFHGHGTFCAGIITGDGKLNNTYKGVAPGVDILNIKVLSQLGIGLWSWIISGIEYAIVHGADIIAMCFSMPGYPEDPVNLAITAAIKRGMIVITAAGDEGPAYSSISAPGMAPVAITVGAFNDFTHQPASFSGRGPTLSFHTKPDLLASGVNIVSCRPSIPSNLPINVSDFIQNALNYGKPLDTFYTIVNSTSAAAANVTGLVASLLQHSKFLSAEEVKIILQETAISLSTLNPNVQGAGLVNIVAAHSYLVDNSLNTSLTEERLYTPTLFSLGYVRNQNLTAFVTSYGSLIAILESGRNENFTHLIQGQLAIKYNNNVKWLSDMYILRELHNLTSDFSVSQSIITDYSVLCILSMEAWSSINGFRVNLTLINLESTALHNLTIFSSWSTNLFSNQNNNDTCEFNSIDDIIYVHDYNKGNSSYIGSTGCIPSSAHEINTSESIRTQIQANSLLNNDAISKNKSIAMQWDLISRLNSSKFIRFSQYIGVGGSYQGINDSIHAMKNRFSSENVTNLALLCSNISRLGNINQPYTSNVLLINLGNVVVNDSLGMFIINSTAAQTQTFFSKVIHLGRLAPFEFKWVNASWNPTEVDIYSLFWFAGTESLINELVLYLMGFTEEISQEESYMDNFFARNIFIKDNSFKIHSLFPKNIPFAPQLIHFPNDIGIFNISLTTNYPLNNLQVVPIAGNLPPSWISYSLPSQIQNFGSLQIIITLPQTPIIGSFYQKVNITAENFHIGEVWINFSVQYPAGRILFYKPMNLSFQNLLQIEDLFTIWAERLDTIYGSYFNLYNLCQMNNYDVDDFGLLKQYSNFSLDTVISLPFELPYHTSTFQENYSFISNYDLVIICDPEVNLSQTEVDTLIKFGMNGGSLFFLVEPKTECEHYSINSILNRFGILIKNSFNSITDQIFINPNQHDISRNLTRIRLYTFVTFQNLSVTTLFTQYNGEPTILVNDTLGKILCVGDSSLFNASCITELDNFQFLNNSLNWLLKDNINISIIINKNNESAPLRIGEHLSISIHITSNKGLDLFNNLTLFSCLITPSNRLLYMIFFQVQIDRGWYNTLYLDGWLNETGTYYLVIYANSPSQTSSYGIQQLVLEDAAPPDDDKPPIPQEWATWLQNFLGMLIALIITNIIVGILLYRRRQWKKQMTIVEYKEKLKREVSNIMSEYHLYIKETDEVLDKSEINDPDKLRMILDSQERQKDLLEKLKKFGKQV